MFETTGIIDEKLLKEVKIYMLGRKQRIFFGIILFALAVMAIVNLFQRDYSTMIICLAGMGLIILEIVLVINKGITVTINRMVEVGGKSESEYTTRFDDEGIYMHNHTTGGEGIIKYETIAKFVETKNAYFLFTKAGQYVVSFKTGAFKREDLVEFLREKPTRIKWRR